MPSVFAHLHDKDVDMELKRSCEQFIVDVSQSIAEPIMTVIFKSEALQHRSNSTIKLQFSPHDLNESFNGFQLRVKQKLPDILKLIDRYIEADAAVLKDSIQNSISDYVSKFAQIAVTAEVTINLNWNA